MLENLVSEFYSLTHSIVVVTLQVSIHSIASSSSVASESKLLLFFFVCLFYLHFFKFRPSSRPVFL